MVVGPHILEDRVDLSHQGTIVLEFLGLDIEEAKFAPENTRALASFIATHLPHRGNGSDNHIDGITKVGMFGDGSAHADFHVVWVCTKYQDPHLNLLME